MKRIGTLFAAGLAMAMLFGGCPNGDGGDGGGGGGGGLGGDPVTPSIPSLSITSNASILQFNAAAIPTPQFLRRADLSAVLSNATSTSIAWSITVLTPGANSALQFEDEQGNFSNSASGQQASVTAIRAPAAEVSHQVTAVATLSNGETLTTQIQILVVRDPLIGGDSTFLSTTPTADPAVGVNADREVVLDAQVSGAVGAVTAQWNPVDIGSLPEGVILPSDLNEPTITLVIEEGVSGVFPFRVTVTDSVGNIATGVVNVFVGIVDLTVNVRPTRVQLDPSSAVTLRTLRIGGATDLDPNDPDAFVYFWTVFDESNNDITDNVAISPPSGTIRDGNSSDWEFTGLNPGAYRFVVRVRDRLGGEAIDSTNVTLSTNLSLSIAASRQRLGVNQGFTIRALRTGGQQNYRYTFSAINENQSNAAGLTTLPPNNQINNGVSPDFAVGGFSTPGDYRIFATVTDAAGNSATGATNVTVGDVLTLDVRANKTFVQPGDPDPVNFVLDVNGGVGPYNYVYSMVRSPGATGAIALLPTSPRNNIAGDQGVQWAVPEPGAGAEGTYRLDVTVTDSVGNTAVRSLSIVVATSGGGLQVDLQAFQFQVAPGTNHAPLFRTQRTNGTGPTYQYLFRVFNSAGTNQVASFTGLPAANQTANAAVNTWNANINGALTPGTYRVEVELTDQGTGDVARDSLELLVADILTVNVVPVSTLVAPGVPVGITAAANGGLGAYTYAWSAVDPFGATGDVGGFPREGRFSSTSAATTVWVPPTYASGTHKVTVQATDNVLGTTVRQTIAITVNDGPVVAERIFNPPASQLDLSGVVGLFEPEALLEGIGGATAVIDFVPANPDPGLDYARSITYQFFDNDAANLVVNSITFVGTNQRGEVISHTDTSVTIDVTEETTVPFRTLERVTVDYENASANDALEIGIGDFFGLRAPHIRNNDGNAATRAFQVLGTGTDLAANPQTATLLTPANSANFERTLNDPDQQGVRFGAAIAPDGTRDYILQYEPYTGMSVLVFSDDYDLDVSNGDVAGLLFKVIGGRPPYNFTFADLGSRSADNTVDNNFSMASPQNGVSGDLTLFFTPPAVATAEEHVIRVRVVDADGNRAVGTANIVIRP